MKPSFTTEKLGSAALDNSGQNPGQEPRDRRQVLPAVRTGEERAGGGGGPEEGRGVQAGWWILLRLRAGTPQAGTGVGGAGSRARARGDRCREAGSKRTEHVGT